MTFNSTRANVLPAREEVAAMVRRPELLHALLEERFPEMSGHWGWVSLYASLISSRLGLSGEEAGLVATAAGLMDLGMLWMEDSARLDGGEPTERVRESIRRHPLEGERALASVVEDRRILPMIRHHHEWWNGQGYPDGLEGKAIPLGARVIAVADAFTAMLSPRPWRPPCSLDDVLREIMRSRGSQFDPAAADAFLDLADERFGLPEGDSKSGGCPLRTQAVAYLSPQGEARGGRGLLDNPDWRERVELIELLWDLNGVRRNRAFNPPMQRSTGR